MIWSLHRRIARYAVGLQRTTCIFSMKAVNVTALCVWSKTPVQCTMFRTPCSVRRCVTSFVRSVLIVGHVDFSVSRFVAICSCARSCMMCGVALAISWVSAVYMITFGSRYMCIFYLQVRSQPQFFGGGKQIWVESICLRFYAHRKMIAVKNAVCYVFWE